MPASHRTFPRRLWLAVAATLLIPATALAAADAPAPPAAPSRAEIERIVERAQAQAREATERAREQTREALERAEHYRQAQRDVLAQLDYDLDLSTLAFIGSEFGPAREIVKNAPYTADAVTESIQVLQDGNRIVKRSTTKLARDTYGRTRQEKEGPRGAAVYLFDPIDNRNYVLNPQRRTATRIPRVPDPPVPPMPPHTGELAVPEVPAVPGVAPVPPTPPVPPAPPAPNSKTAAVVTTQGQDRVVVRRGDGTRADDVRVEVLRIGAGEPGMPQVIPIPPIAMPLLPAGKGERKSLGTRDFDGVKADGTQTTQTIPAGEIGNEKPIVITSERWFSPDLQLVVFARTRDPRAGETTYRLTNLKRGEPPAELFRVPADYRARESRG
jgi:hypothetical protein